MQVLGCSTVGRDERRTPGPRRPLLFVPAKYPWWRRLALLLALAVFVEGASAHGSRLHHRQVGTASWYGAQAAGRETASGTPFDPDRMTAADRFLPLGTCVRVTNLTNHRSVRLRVSDRGPYSRGRLIDVSEAAAIKLGMKHKGVTRVRVVVVSDCPSDAMATGDD